MLTNLVKINLKQIYVVLLFTSIFKYMYVFIYYKYIQTYTYVFSMMNWRPSLNIKIISDYINPFLFTICLTTMYAGVFF